MPDPGLVVVVPGLAGEVVGVLTVELDERPRRRPNRGQGLRVGIDEQPLPHDVVSLVRRRRPPLVGDTPDHVLQPLQRLQAMRTTDLFGGTHHRRFTRRMRGGNGDREQDTAGAFAASVSD